MSDNTDTIRSASQQTGARRLTLSEFEAKKPSRFMDPCAIEAKASYKCLDDNNYDKDMCTDYFLALIICNGEDVGG
ncbi:hypothetical protein GGH12_003389 [Coemansia sp. RSA 1822]|nr:hypothetical protein GGH12_003389 [Coemansia sp. RSA 1822]